jgi:hypothetical protein
MKPYKVIYLEGTYLTKKGKHHLAGHLDGMDTANDLEALIIEQANAGYELYMVTPIQGLVTARMSMPQTTTGFMVTFKKKD